MVLKRLFLHKTKKFLSNLLHVKNSWHIFAMKIRNGVVTGMDKFRVMAFFYDLITINN